MEQFDEQWQRIAEQMHDAPMFWCKAGWRAALELVFGWLDYSTEHEEIKDRIQKELGDA